MFGNQLSGAQPSDSEGHGPANANGEPPRGPRRRGGPSAGGGLPNRAEGSVVGSENGSVASYGAPKRPPSSAPDLATRMHEDIDSGNYDCPICLNAVTRGSKIWACSMCYHVAHHACVAAWVKQALNQGLALEKIRCPACNSEAEAAASMDVNGNGSGNNTESGGGFFGRKLCWCGKQKTAGVAPAALPPHSCGRICDRARPDCHHTCPSACHAGPCPPCTETGPLVTCFCGKETSIKPCAAGVQRSWSCGAPCDQLLACRTHKCQQTCHPDDCGACTVPMPSTCFCGKTQEDLPCKEREPAQQSANYGQLIYGSGSSFEGVFRCDTACGRAFDCGKHFCAKPCHVQDTRPEHCPTSPDVITHCLCGKTLLASSNSLSPPRKSCQDPIPACDKVCGKTLVCGHACAEMCHAGACTPCPQIVAASCACGQTSSQVVCSDRGARDGLQCETVCRAWLSCKQHRCNIVCCPGKLKAAARLAEKPRKRSAQGTSQTEIEAEHTCLRPCGRLLKCGKHTCPQVCHKGACYSCVAYILDDLSCPCGHTVVEAPFLCGTSLPACDADCPRPLPCGHPSIPHRCHDDRQQPCPRCQRLVSKSCLCGKLVLSRVACGADNIQCSNVCGKTLKCQVHKCRLSCHAEGKCEDANIEIDDGAAAACRQVCARPKTSCGHPCTNRCHGSEDACSENEPCGAAIEVTCPCQRQVRKVRCNVCVAGPEPAYRRPACDDECLRIQRNALLKDALRISDDYKDEHLVYSTAIMEYFMNNRAFATAQEEKIRSFFASALTTPDGEELGAGQDKKAEKVCIFKPMKRHERQFLHLMAESFGLRSESRDAEPHRYVFLSRARTGFTAVPSISLAESEEIYLRLRDKSKAEADEAAALKAKEEETLQEEVAVARAVRKRPFNAIFVPAALAATMGGGESGNNTTILDDDAFQTIIEAWQQQQQHKRWAPPSSNTGNATTSTLHQHTIQPSADVILRVLVPAAAPGVVEQLLVFLLSYMNEWWGDAAGQSTSQLALCHVDTKYNVLRLGNDGNHESGYDTDDQWNVVATSSASRRESASATPVGGARSSPSKQQLGPPLSTKRVVFKLRQKNTMAAEAERKRWMAILAQQPTDEHPNEDEVEEGEREEEVKEDNTLREDNSEVPFEAGTEALRAALEQAFLEEGEGSAL